MRFVPASVACLVLAAAAVAMAQTPTFSGYAYADCTPGQRPSTRLILVLGPVPAGIPERVPRPSIDVLVSSGVDAAVAAPIAISPEPAEGANAIARSCPVVGSCGAASTGTLSVKRDGSAVSGDFHAQWGNALPREGRFTVEWRDNAAGCK